MAEFVSKAWFDKFMKKQAIDAGVITKNGKHRKAKRGKPLSKRIKK